MVLHNVDSRWNFVFRVAIHQKRQISILKKEFFHIQTCLLLFDDHQHQPIQWTGINVVTIKTKLSTNNTDKTGTENWHWSEAKSESETNQPCDCSVMNLMWIFQPHEDRERTLQWMHSSLGILKAIFVLYVSSIPVVIRSIVKKHQFTKRILSTSRTRQPFWPG